MYWTQVDCDLVHEIIHTSIINILNSWILAVRPLTPQQPK